MEVVGKIKVINPEQQVSATFVKRELVVATEEQYPQFISINFVQDKTELLDRFSVGDEVKVSINLRGREWVNPLGETKYFNDIQGWRIEPMSETSGRTNPNTSSQPQGQATQTNPKEFEPSTNFNEEEHDDLPF
jgi:hypothetical protein